MTTEAAEMRDNMGIVEGFRGGYRRWTIMEADMHDNGEIRDEDTGRCRWSQRRRCGTSNRRDVGKTDIDVFGWRL